MEFYLCGIIMFGGNFAPRDWTMCNGQLLAISQFNAVFALLGTAYGGDGRSTFGCPDLRGRAPIGFQQGPGLPPYILGQRTGVLEHTQRLNELAPHTHTAVMQGGGGGAISAKVNISTADPTTNITDPEGAYLATGSGQHKFYNPTLGTTAATLASDAIDVSGGGSGGEIIVGSTGSGVPFSLMQPSLAVNFVMCMQGLFPPRN